jgi:hypothetical protein
MTFKKGDTIQVWDWMAQNENSNSKDVIRHHGEIGIVVRRTRSNDVRVNIGGQEYKFGKDAGTCWLIGIPHKGLVHVNECWMKAL